MMMKDGKMTGMDDMEDEMMKKKYGESESVTPFKEILNKLDEAIKKPDPSLLKEIKMDLMDMETMIDGEGDDREGMDEDMSDEGMGNEPPTLTIAIGKMKKNRGGLK